MSCKVTEVVVNKRMSQGEKAKDTKEKKKLPGWSIEEGKAKHRCGGRYGRDEKIEKSEQE